MRRPPLALLATLLVVLALPAAAQQRPGGLQPIPEPPPPPPGMADPSMEPQVTIIKRGEDKVEEFRVRGKLYMIRVTPPHGKPYYLVDRQGNGAWARQDALDSGSLAVPQWVIGTF
jgi:hypothetical protein